MRVSNIKRIQETADYVFVFVYQHKKGERK